MYAPDNVVSKNFIVWLSAYLVRGEPKYRLDSPNNPQNHPHPCDIYSAENIPRRLRVQYCACVYFRVTFTLTRVHSAIKNRSGFCFFSSSYKDRLKAVMVSQETSIPGLFSSDLHNQSGTSSAPSLFSSSATGANSSEGTSAGGDLFIHLRGSGLIMELNNEKENLDSSFVHSKRLIDEGLTCLFYLMHTMLSPAVV